MGLTIYERVERAITMKNEELRMGTAGALGAIRLRFASARHVGVASPAFVKGHLPSLKLRRDKMKTKKLNQIKVN